MFSSRHETTTFGILFTDNCILSHWRPVQKVNLCCTWMTERGTAETVTAPGHFVYHVYHLARLVARRLDAEITSILRRDVVWAARSGTTTKLFSRNHFHGGFPDAGTFQIPSLVREILERLHLN